MSRPRGLDTIPRQGDDPAMVFASRPTRLAPRIAALVAVLLWLLPGLAAASHHHHELGGEASAPRHVEACAACTLAHAPALGATPATAPEAPPVLLHVIAAHAPLAPPRPACPCPESRGPPTD